MGRRWGKTVMAGDVALACAANGGAVAWIVPTYRNARPIWRFAEVATKNVASRLSINNSELTMKFPGGGWMGVYTADSPVGILGEAFDVVILEEAARHPPNVWSETVMPTLADRDGRAFIISTPRGRNWFYNEFQKGLKGDPEYKSFTAPSSANPMPTIRKAFELAKQRVSARSFRQEWLAEFVEDGGGVFRNIRSLSTLERQLPIEGHRYVIGVDWARTNDESVFSVWDMESLQEVFLDRMSDTSYTIQIQRLKALREKYNDAYVRAESNGLGDPLIEQSQKAGVPVMSFLTTNLTKDNIVDQMALRCEKESVTFQNDPDGIAQMESFESSRTPTGMVKYAAPQGGHDDVVMARCIALDGVDNMGSFLFEDDRLDMAREIEYD